MVVTAQSFPLKKIANRSNVIFFFLTKRKYRENVAEYYEKIHLYS